jgi:aspartyl-tRNA synthetase
MELLRNFSGFCTYGTDATEVQLVLSAHFVGMQKPKFQLCLFGYILVMISLSLITNSLLVHGLSRTVRRTTVRSLLEINDQYMLSHNSNRVRKFHAASLQLRNDISEVDNKVDYFKVNDLNDKYEFGTYNTIASQQQIDRKYVNVEDLGTESGPKVGEKVWVRGRISSVRAKGNACFIVLRSKGLYTVQGLHFKDKENVEDSKKLIKYAGSIACESIVDLYGTLSSAEVKSCSQGNVEIQIQKIFVVSNAPVQLPFLLEDAARSQEEIDNSQNSERPFAGVSQDLRLNNRWLDLRVPANNAIMRIRSGVSMLFREALLNEGFVEINSPKLISGESEGGAEVFRTSYFGQSASLAQSPQLYKQMAISADLDKVFEIGPVFRAENSNTRRHLCEFTGLDIEMAINSHYNEVLEVAHKMFRHIFNGLENRFAKELSIIREQYPSSPVKFTEKPLIIHWDEGMKLLKDAGFKDIDEYGDLSSSLELSLGSLIKEKYDADFYILDQYPSAIRPFYTMVNQTNPLFSNSYDMFIRGQEICSGAQRCHEVDTLISRIKEKGMDPNGPIQFYIDSFRHGVSPHAGAGIGLDRVVFLYLGLDNVRKASMFPRDPGRLIP